MLQNANVRGERRGEVGNVREVVNNFWLRESLLTLDDSRWTSGDTDAKRSVTSQRRARARRARFRRTNTQTDMLLA